MRAGDMMLLDFPDRPHGAEVDNVPDALRVLLVEAGGSVRALARMLGRPRRTVRDWLAGTRPRGGGADLVEASVAAQRQASLSPEREDELRNGFDIVTVGGTLSISDDEARVLELEFIGGYGNQLVDAYLEGASADELEEIFIAGIADDWYREHVGNPAVWDTDWLDY